MGGRLGQRIRLVQRGEEALDPGAVTEHSTPLCEPLPGPGRILGAPALSLDRLVTIASPFVVLSWFPAFVAAAGFDTPFAAAIDPLSTRDVRAWLVPCCQVQRCSRGRVLNCDHAHSMEHV
jgi:hypothetical protein